MQKVEIIDGSLEVTSNNVIVGKKHDYDDLSGTFYINACDLKVLIQNYEHNNLTMLVTQMNCIDNYYDYTRTILTNSQAVDSLGRQLLEKENKITKIYNRGFWSRLFNSIV